MQQSIVYMNVLAPRAEATVLERLSVEVRRQPTRRMAAGARFEDEGEGEGVGSGARAAHRGEELDASAGR